MIIRVEPDVPTPVYEQIRLQVTRLVASGRLRPGDRLPTIRQLALDIGVAKGTVERAYEHLAADGVVTQQGRRGTVVCEGGAHTDPAALVDAATTFVVTALQLGTSQDEALHAVRQAWQEVSPLS